MLESRHLASLRTKLLSWLRRWGFLDPNEPEPISVAQLRLFAKLVASLCVLAILLDAGIYLALRHNAAISQPALKIFATLNISALAVAALAAYALQLRPEQPVRGTEVGLCFVFATTTVVWIQLTGTVSSYFIMAAAIEIVLFRAAWGWKAGWVTHTTIALAQLVAYLLEELALLKPTSLLVAPVYGLESIASYRGVAMISIEMCYAAAFLGSHAVVTRLRAQRRELERIRRDFAGIAAGARRGRLSGTEISRWFVDELLGRGGMGEVYAAHDENGRQVAIKVLYPHLIEDDTALARFEREQAAVVRAQSISIPQLFEVARSEDGTPYLVMERLRGEDLSALFRRKDRLSHAEVRELAHALANALDALHGLGIVHRDLTPANIFVVASAEPWPDLRLLDLGVCKLRDHDGPSLTETSSILGTPGYLSPEQIMGPKSSIGPATDLFACAAILYRALTGEPAFASGQLVQAIESVCRLDPIWPSQLCEGLSASVDEVFRKGLSKDPTKRYSSARELARALSDALASEPPSAAIGA